MAAAIYPLAKQEMLKATVDLNGGNVKAAYVTSAYTYSAAHQFYSDLTGVVASTANATGKTFTTGTFSCSPVTATAVAAGSTIAAVVFYIDTGVVGTSKLISFDDQATGEPLATNGSDITYTPNASGIFSL